MSDSELDSSNSTGKDTEEWVVVGSSDSEHDEISFSVESLAGSNDGDKDIIRLESTPTAFVAESVNDSVSDVSVLNEDSMDVEDDDDLGSDVNDDENDDFLNLVQPVVQTDINYPLIKLIRSVFVVMAFGTFCFVLIVSPVFFIVAGRSSLTNNTTKVDTTIPSKRCADVFEAKKLTTCHESSEFCRRDEKCTKDGCSWYINSGLFYLADAEQLASFYAFEARNEKSLIAELRSLRRNYSDFSRYHDAILARKMKKLRFDRLVRNRLAQRLRFQKQQLKRLHEEQEAVSKSLSSTVQRVLALTQQLSFKDLELELLKVQNLVDLSNQNTLSNDMNKLKTKLEDGIIENAMLKEKVEVLRRKIQLLTTSLSFENKSTTTTTTPPTVNGDDDDHDDAVTRLNGEHDDYHNDNSRLSSSGKESISSSFNTNWSLFVEKISNERPLIDQSLKVMLKMYDEVKSVAVRSVGEVARVFEHSNFGQKIFGDPSKLGEFAWLNVTEAADELTQKFLGTFEPTKRQISKLADAAAELLNNISVKEKVSRFYGVVQNTANSCLRKANGHAKKVKVSNHDSDSSSKKFNNVKHGPCDCLIKPCSAKTIEQRSVDEEYLDPTSKSSISNTNSQDKHSDIKLTSWLFDRMKTRQIIRNVRRGLNERLLKYNKEKLVFSDKSFRSKDGDRRRLPGKDDWQFQRERIRQSSRERIRKSSQSSFLGAIFPSFF